MGKHMSEVLEYLLQSYKCVSLRQIDAAKSNRVSSPAKIDVVSTPMYSDLITCSRMHAKVLSTFCGTHECCEKCAHRYSNGKPAKVKKLFNNRINF